MMLWKVLTSIGMILNLDKKISSYKLIGWVKEIK